MQLDAILKLPMFTLPAKNTSGEPFITFAESIISHYISYINTSRDLLVSSPAKFVEYPEFRDMVSAFGTSLINVIRLYKRESPETAYQEFTKVLTHYARFIIKNPLSHFYQNKTHILYRAKSSDLDVPRDQFFHTPFEYDSFVEGTRFSIPGTPALYLSNALIVGYRETETIIEDYFQAVKYNPKFPLSFLNLDFNEPDPALLIHDKNLYDEQLQMKGLLFPLLFLCHCEKTSRAAPQEYIIPQMVAKWIKEYRSFDGIKYPSVRISNKNYHKDFYNLFMPPQEVGDKGICPVLKSLFDMSDVCSLKRHKKNIDDFFLDEYTKDPLINPAVEFIEWNAAKHPYNATSIGKMEYYLKKAFPLSPIL